MRSATSRNALLATSKTKRSIGWPNSNADTISTFAINRHGRTVRGLLRLTGVLAISAMCSIARNATTARLPIFPCDAFRSARTSWASGQPITIMDFPRTRAALAAYHRLMNEAPTFGNSPEKVERWDKECLAAAIAVREAFYREATQYTLDECLTMDLARLQALVEASERPSPGFARTLQAIDAYYDERKEALNCTQVSSG